MDHILRIAGVVLSLPWLFDAAIRRRLARASAAAAESIGPGTPTTPRWLVLIPSRAEGAAVLDTLVSVEAASAHGPVATVVLVDGSDPETERLAKPLSTHVVVKEPAGPTKGVALRWFVEHHPELLEATDAVLVLDVGSRIDPAFFDRVDWSDDSRAFQARLRGVGGGVGSTASLSERMAQEWQDRGRQALGWTVHLRGTGMALAPDLLRSIAPRLWTSVEDTEATLLLAAEGIPVRLAPAGATVEDVKPSRVNDAARQRSRWLVGKLSLLAHQPRSLARLFLRRPIEGLAFTCELLSRPYSLTFAARTVLAAGFLADGLLMDGGVVGIAVAVVLVGSLISDLALLRRATDAGWRSLAVAALQMITAWLRAIVLLPYALLGWARARRR
jgi:cellulose synthase/poly-beta-1,6-N-acetylglucosamine synthase-like glycosyltransferase